VGGILRMEFEKDARTFIDDIDAFNFPPTKM